MPLKTALYRLARACGLFAVARRATRNRLRILAYHGFALGDEVRFRSKLFITPQTFQRRLAILQRGGYRVVGLDEAVRNLSIGNLPPGAVAITIDDGYASTLTEAAPRLRRYGFPATVYLTSYYMDKQTAVFDLAVAYMMWKSPKSKATLAWPTQREVRNLDLSSAEARVRSGAELIAYGHRLESESERCELSRAIGACLDVSYDEIESRGCFRLLSADEARQLQALGVTIGLHTHRHRFPVDDLSVCRSELNDNESFLTACSTAYTRHFCYPSGIYSPSQWQVLAECGMVSATTCETGLARKSDLPFGLPRFLDGEMVQDIEFEAEISGFAELLRAFLRIDRRANTQPTAA